MKATAAGNIHAEWLLATSNTDQWLPLAASRKETFNKQIMMRDRKINLLVRTVEFCIVRGLIYD
jgi:hypothetical protein